MRRDENDLLEPLELADSTAESPLPEVIAVALEWLGDEQGAAECGQLEGEAPRLEDRPRAWLEAIDERQSVEELGERHEDPRRDRTL